MSLEQMSLEQMSLEQMPLEQMSIASAFAFRTNAFVQSDIRIKISLKNVCITNVLEQMSLEQMSSAQLSHSQVQPWRNVPVEWRKKNIFLSFGRKRKSQEYIDWLSSTFCVSRSD